MILSDPGDLYVCEKKPDKLVQHIHIVQNTHHRIEYIKPNQTPFMQKYTLLSKSRYISLKLRRTRQKKDQNKIWVLSIGMGLWVFGCPAEQKEKNETGTRTRALQQRQRQGPKTRANTMGLLHLLAYSSFFFFSSFAYGHPPIASALSPACSHPLSLLTRCIIIFFLLFCSQLNKQQAKNRQKVVAQWVRVHVCICVVHDFVHNIPHYRISPGQFNSQKTMMTCKKKWKKGVR